MLRILIALTLMLPALDVPPKGGLTLKDPVPQSDLAQTKGFVNAKQIEGLCTAAEDAKDGKFDMYLGYLAGSIDQLIAQAGVGGKSARRLCPNLATTLEDFRQMFLLYVQLHPKAGTAAAGAVIERAVVPSLKCDLLRFFE